MIHTGKGHADHLQIRAGFHHVPAVFEIGEHHTVGALAALDQRFRIGLPVVIVYNLRLLASLQMFQRLLHLRFQTLPADSQRFQKYYFHVHFLLIFLYKY